jgi:hypothetical protein
VSSSCLSVRSCSGANRSNTSSSIPAIMGAQPSPNARTRSSTVRPAPPTMIGGYGVWTGLGQVCSEVDELPVVFGLILGPDLDHRLDAFSQQPHPGFGSVPWLRIS